MPILSQNIPVKIAFIAADGEPTTSDVEISEVSSNGATLLSHVSLSKGAKIGLAITSRDECVSRIFLDVGLVSRPFFVLRTQATVLGSTQNTDGADEIRIRFTGNLRVTYAAGS